MSEICSYIYTNGGLRFESGSGVVTLEIDGVTRDLRVVRNGKGASRLERGEITLGDLEEFTDDEGLIKATFELDGEEIQLNIDPRRAMGGNGRELVSDLNASVEGLSPQQLKALAKEQINTLPYGTKNAEEARTRVEWAFSQGAIEDVSIEAMRNLATLLDRDTTQMMIRNQPSLATSMVFKMAGETCDPEMLVVASQEARAVLREAGFLTREGAVAVLATRGLDEEEIEDLLEAGGVLDTTYGALIGDVPLDTWLLTREGLVGESGVPWSLRTTRVTDKEGKRVRDVAKLEVGDEVTVSPRWITKTYSDSPMRGAFSRTEIFSGVGLDSGSIVVAPENTAVWRSQGGTVDTYSKLPRVVMKEITTAMTDDELTQALVWSSPRDFYALRDEARTEEHMNIAKERLIAETRDNVLTLGNSPWNDESDRGQGWELHLATAKGHDERNEAIKSIRGSIDVLERIKSQVSRDASEGDIKRTTDQAARNAASLAEDLESADRSMGVSLDMRGEWLGGSLESVRHDKALYTRVKEALERSNDAARNEQRLLRSSRESAELVTECLRRGEELRAAGNTSESARVIANAVEHLNESERHITASMKITVDIGGDLGYGLEKTRNTERRKILRKARLDEVESFMSGAAELP
jgi:hypothetical protein